MQRRTRFVLRIQRRWTQIANRPWKDKKANVQSKEMGVEGCRRSFQSQCLKRLRLRSLKFSVMPLGTLQSFLR